MKEIVLTEEERSALACLLAALPVINAMDVMTPLYGAEKSAEIARTVCNFSKRIGAK